MSAIAIGLALFAALLHASWNAFLRNGGDRLKFLNIMSVSGTVVALPFVFIYPLPSLHTFYYLALSTLLQVFYGHFLVAAYRYGELSQVYPVIRGTIPLLVTLGGFLFAGQVLDHQHFAGVLLIAAGIMSLALGKSRASGTSLMFALAAGAIVATYVTVDSIGVRQAESSAAYTAWVLVLYGLLLPVSVFAVRGRYVIDIKAPETWKALTGGLVAMLSYGVVLAAFSYGPAGPITALRETSVIFAALIGRIFLSETLTIRRVLACVVVAAGAILLGR
jgi:uncharacterized membrane protein